MCNIGFGRMSSKMLMYKMELFDLLTALVTLGGYTTIVCYFFYTLNEKRISRSDDKMEKHITRLEDKMEKHITRLEDKMEKKMEESDKHWRELFMYINKKVDNPKKRNF